MKLAEGREEEPVEEKRMYLAYGSNLNIAQMQARCPDAGIVGTSELKDWRLLYKGSRGGYYLTIERAAGYTVPVAVWAVSMQDERNLDCYEGYPSFYYKKEFSVKVRRITAEETDQVKAFAYIMYEEYKTGCPAGSYVQCCREGYRDFGFDPAFLEEAYEFSTKG